MVGVEKMVLADVSKWIMLIIVIGVVIFVIKAGMKIINILIMVLLLGFCWYSFFTEEGAARLSIVFTGHPIIAYTTNLDKQEDISNDETSYFISSKDVIVKGEKLEYVECHTKWIVRLPNIEQ